MRTRNVFDIGVTGRHTTAGKEPTNPYDALFAFGRMNFLGELLRGNDYGHKRQVLFICQLLKALSEVLLSCLRKAFDAMPIVSPHIYQIYEESELLILRHSLAESQGDDGLLNLAPSQEPWLEGRIKEQYLDKVLRGCCVPV